MLDKIALTLLIIGGLNWGSVGIFQFDLVAWICGGDRNHKPYCLHPCRTFRNLVHYTFIQGHKRHRDGRNGCGFVVFAVGLAIWADIIRPYKIVKTITILRSGIICFLHCKLSTRKGNGGLPYCTIK